MPWKFRKRGAVFVELFESGHMRAIGVRTDDDRKWVAEVAEPELRAVWEEHLRR
jgi:hypothetical protein